MHIVLRKIRFLFFLAAFEAFACSEVTVTNGSTFSVGTRTMDFPEHIPTSLELSTRGLKNTSPTNGITTNPPLQWVSKYGGVYITSTLGQLSAVVDGVNEKGLIAAFLWDQTAVYPPLPPPPGVPVLVAYLLPRYFLDNFATVNEALASLSNFYVLASVLDYYGPTVFPLHFTLHDRSGDSALIEFNGSSTPNVIHPLAPSAAHPNFTNVTTNEPQYAVQIANLSNYAYFGGALPLPGDVDSMSRFARLAAFLSTTPISSLTPDQVVPVAFGLIYTVVEPLGAIDPTGGIDWQTQWIRGYDNINLINFYQADKNTVFSIDLSKIKFSSPKVKHRFLNFYDPNLDGDITALLLLGKNVNKFN